MKRSILASLLVLTAACGLQLPPQTPPPVATPPTPIEAPAAADPMPIIVRVYADLLRRQPDPYGIQFYGARLRSGEMDEASMRAHVMQSAEYQALHAPAPPVPNITIRGRQFFDGDRMWVPRLVSGLTLLVRTQAQQEAYLDWASKTGFNGVRVFAGALTWANQSPKGARAALPGLLDRAAARGLVVEVTALTDTGTGYDARGHVAAVVEILRGRRGVLLELANELGHHTQSDEITPDRMRQWGREFAEPAGLLWAVGATLDTDEPIGGVYPAHGGRYMTAHLDRGRNAWNQLRRVREIYAIVEAHGAPALNNEPIGCAEPGTPGQRYYDPAWAFTLGALDRAFGVGGVHHSQSGLMAELPGPVQQACADAYVAAHRAIDSVLDGVVGQYRNVGHGGSPLVGARFVEGGSSDGVVRAYSFVSGDRGVTVLVGAKGDAGLEWGNDWRSVREIARSTAQDGRAAVILQIGR